ncbi:MAG: response regulator [Acidobacteriota bacterium]|nr:response regulator [Acidobacteriota bacterium]
MTRRVLIAVDDIFFASKIRAAAEGLGVEFDTARGVDAAVEKARANRPDLVIADLHSERCDPVALARALKADARLSDVPLVGFFSHVQTELRDRALAAGFAQVLPRSAFVARLREIVGGRDA